MIRYKIKLDDLEARIDKTKPGWRQQARYASQYFAAQGSYSEPPQDPLALKPFWGQIKWVYLDLQRRKCAYCECRPSTWSGYYAVEHFRPKSGVDDWPPANHPRKAEFTYASTGQSAVGYHLLAYHPLNYVAACQRCNTSRKRAYFPIAVPPRGTAVADPVALFALERPYLIYPLGEHDANPEDLIKFNGIIPYANSPIDGYEQRRADVTIDVFDLEMRDDLRT